MGRGSRARGRRERKRNKELRCYVHVSAPHSECHCYILQGCTTGGKRGEGRWEEKSGDPRGAARQRKSSCPCWASVYYVPKLKDNNFQQYREDLEIQWKNPGTLGLGLLWRRKIYMELRESIRFLNNRHLPTDGGFLKTSAKVVECEKILWKDILYWIINKVKFLAL